MQSNQELKQEEFEKLQQDLKRAEEMIDESKRLRETSAALEELRAAHPGEGLEEVEKQVRAMEKELSENEEALEKACKPGMLGGFFDKITGRSQLKEALATILNRVRTGFEITNSLIESVKTITRQNEVAVTLLERNNDLLGRLQSNTESITQGVKKITDVVVDLKEEMIRRDEENIRRNAERDAEYNRKAEEREFETRSAINALAEMVRSLYFEKQGQSR